MFNFLSGLFGVLIGFILLVIIIYLIIRIILNKNGFKNYKLKDIYNEYQASLNREKKRHKQVSGMTTIFLPTILDDFSNFNEKEFYSKTEKVIRTVLTAIETNDIKKLEDEDLSLLKDRIILQIKDLEDSKIKYRYDDIIFHRHAIRDYKKEEGMYKLSISTSLEYYYKEEKDNRIVRKSDKEKKQTRYTTTFVYIYDTKKAGFDIDVLGLNCPNCGSPIISLEDNSCKYCRSKLNITIANLEKCWKVIDIKEDY